MKQNSSTNEVETELTNEVAMTSVLDEDFAFGSLGASLSEIR